MSGISQLLETARRALMAQQYGMSVTGHNIANAGTTGYSRQRADLATTAPLQTAYGFLGTGVTVQTVSRLRDRFIDQQIRSANDTLGLAASDYRILSQIEAIFNEPSDASLSTGLSQFFAAWQDLSTNPEDAVTRNVVLAQGQALTDTFHRLSGQLTTQRNALPGELTERIERINALAREISDLNVTIGTGMTNGQGAGDLQDLRDSKIAELSGLANITVSGGNNGAVLVSLGGTLIAGSGTVLALKVTSGEPATIAGTSFEQLRVVTVSGGFDVDLHGGEAGSILKSFNSTLPDAMGRLDQLAGAIVEAVNQQHTAGYGRQQPPRTGVRFFMGTDAASMAIDLTDPSDAPGSNPSIDNIAASSSPAAAGDNSIALLISGILDKRPLVTSGGVTLLDGLSLSEFYNQIVTDIGSSVNATGAIVTSQELFVSQLTAQQEAIAGVSLDEEMANMIKFQNAFDAAAKMVSTVNEMYTTILEMV